MIDYSGLKAIFGDKLPESHIFFATVAANKFIPNYSTLRKELGMTTAHTNRKVWKKFVSEYNAATGTPALVFTKNLLPTATAVAGDNVTFSVIAAGGNTPYTYEWFWNNVKIDSSVNPTAATANLVNNAVTEASSGGYKVTVTDNAGAKITSLICTLTVTPVGG